MVIGIHLLSGFVEYSPLQNHQRACAMLQGMWFVGHTQASFISHEVSNFDLLQ